MTQVKPNYYKDLDMTNNQFNQSCKEFFDNSIWLQRYALRPLSHIEPDWELVWDDENDCYLEEDGTLAKELNHLIQEIASTPPPVNYHDNEDALAYYLVDKGWPITKINGRWDYPDYERILEQGGFSDTDEKNLVKAASGRTHAAMDFDQYEFDDMEDGHMKILASVIAVILYHRV